VDVVVCTTNPYCTIVFELGATQGEPIAIELVDIFRSSAFVPITFVHADLLTTLHANTAVAKEVGRVGKDSINRVIFYLAKSLHAITIEDGEVGICNFI
jgi:hypothetical protein